MKTMLFRAALALPALAVCAPVAALAVTPEDVYREMSHRHANLDLSSGGFTREEAAYLGRIFELVDLAIVEKSQTFLWFQSEGRKGASFRDYKGRVNALIAQIDGVPAPPKLVAIHRLLVEAFREQRAFFGAWQEALDADKGDVTGASTHESRSRFLQSSSQKLMQVYSQLMQMFPNAGQQNFNAFYDHLCVLDLQ